MKKNVLSLIISICSLAAFGQLTPIPLGGEIRFLNGTYHYLLQPGTYNLYSDNGLGYNYSNNITSELNLHAPNCEIRVNGGVWADYPSDWFTVSNACGDDIRHSSGGTPWSATINHYMYSYARLRFKSDGAINYQSCNLTITVQPVPVLTTPESTANMTVYDIQVNNISSSSAEITWEDNNSANTSWTVRYGPFGFKWEVGIVEGLTVTSNTKSVTLTGLTDCTHYAFYVYPTGTSLTNNKPTTPNAFRQYFYSCGVGKHPLEFNTNCNNPLTECFDFTDLTADFVKGTTGTFSDPFATAGIVDNGSLNISSRHTVHNDLTERDVRTLLKLNTVPAGATHSVRLGNWKNGAEAESLTYEYKVDTVQADLFFLRYAALLQDPNHVTTNQPVFTFKIFDEDNVEIDPVCYSAKFVANVALGWNKVGYCSYENYTGSGSEGVADVLWKDWTTVGLDLAPLHGQKIKIQLVTYDCSQGGHYGYAYFHFSCAKKTIIALQCGDNLDENTFVAPPGFNYNWYWGDNPGTSIGSNQQINITGQGSLYCECSFIDKPDCKFTLQAIAGARCPLADFDFEPTEQCGTTVQFANKSTIYDCVNPENNANEMCETAYWDFGDGSPISTEYNPIHTYSIPGTYEIKLIVGIANDACTNTIVKTFSTSVFTTIEETVCMEDLPYNGNGFSNITAGGVYLDTFPTASGCDSIVTLNLTVEQCEPPTFQAVNDTLNIKSCLDLYGNKSVYILENDIIPCSDPVINVLYSTFQNYTVFNSSGYINVEYYYSGLGEKIDSLQYEISCGAEKDTAWIFQFKKEGEYPIIQTLTATCNQIYIKTENNLPAGSSFHIEKEDGTFNDDIFTGISNDINTATFSGLTEGKYYVNICYGYCCVYDSITVSELDSVKINAVICQGDTYNSNGFNESATGIYTRPETTPEGCDYIIELTLDVVNSIITNDAKSICYEELPYIYNDTVFQKNTVSGTYIITDGCNKTILELEVIKIPDVNIIIPEICAGDEDFILNIVPTTTDYIHYFTNYSVTFNAQSIAAGFVNQSGTIADMENININLPDSIYPNHYGLTLSLTNSDNNCNSQMFVMPFDILYPNTIMEQKWGDVIALLNYYYNGHYEFAGYQWYRDGVKLNGEDYSYIYLKNGVLDTTSCYTVEITRPDGTKMFSCCFKPHKAKEQCCDYPIVQENGVIHISKLSDNTIIRLWTVTGILLQSQKVMKTTQYEFASPQQQGVYLIEILNNNESVRKVFPIVVLK